MISLRYLLSLTCGVLLAGCGIAAAQGSEIDPVPDTWWGVVVAVVGIGGTVAGTAFVAEKWLGLFERFIWAFIGTRVTDTVKNAYKDQTHQERCDADRAAIHDRIDGLSERSVIVKQMLEGDTVLGLAGFRSDLQALKTATITQAADRDISEREKATVRAKETQEIMDRLSAVISVVERYGGS